jgi:hypothetical protein
MLRFDLPQHDTRYSVWIELQTYDELPEKARGGVWTLAQVMDAHEAIYILSPHTQQPMRTIAYTDLLAAFPDVDPEAVYVTIQYQ